LLLTLHSTAIDSQFWRLAMDIMQKLLQNTIAVTSMIFGFLLARNRAKIHELAARLAEHFPAQLNNHLVVKFRRLLHNQY